MSMSVKKTKDKPIKTDKHIVYSNIGQANKHIVYSNIGQANKHIVYSNIRQIHEILNGGEIHQATLRRVLQTGSAAYFRTGVGSTIRGTTFGAEARGDEGEECAPSPGLGQQLYNQHGSHVTIGEECAPSSGLEQQRSGQHGSHVTIGEECAPSSGLEQQRSSLHGSHVTIGEECAPSSGLEQQRSSQHGSHVTEDWIKLTRLLNLVLKSFRQDDARYSAGAGLEPRFSGDWKVLQSQDGMTSLTIDVPYRGGRVTSLSTRVNQTDSFSWEPAVAKVTEKTSLRMPGRDEMKTRR